MEELTDRADVTITTSESEPGTALIHLSGEIDCSNADQVRTGVERVLANQAERIIFDLASVSFMDSSGIAVMVLAANGASEVVVQNPSPLVRRVLDATGLSGVLHIS